MRGFNLETQTEDKKEQQKFIQDYEKNKYDEYYDMKKLFKIHQQIKDDDKLVKKSRPNKVDHSLIDFDIIRRKSKIRLIMFDGKEEYECFKQEFSSSNIADVIQRINYCYRNDIHQQDFIRAIADIQNEKSRFWIDISLA